MLPIAKTHAMPVSNARHKVSWRRTRRRDHLQRQQWEKAHLTVGLGVNPPAEHSSAQSLRHLALHRCTSGVPSLSQPRAPPKPSSPALNLCWEGVDSSGTSVGTIGDHAQRARSRTLCFRLASVIAVRSKLCATMGICRTIYENDTTLIYNMAFRLRPTSR